MTSFLVEGVERLKGRVEGPAPGGAAAGKGGVAASQLLVGPRDPRRVVRGVDAGQTVANLKYIMFKFIKENAYKKILPTQRFMLHAI